MAYLSKTQGHPGRCPSANQSMEVKSKKTRVRFNADTKCHAHAPPASNSQSGPAYGVVWKVQARAAWWSVSTTELVGVAITATKYIKLHMYSNMWSLQHSLTDRRFFFQALSTGNTFHFILYTTLYMTILCQQPVIMSRHSYNYSIVTASRHTTGYPTSSAFSNSTNPDED
jgi:hypothetical protein